MHFMDDPIGDFSIFPTYLVSQLARATSRSRCRVTAATSCSAATRPSSPKRSTAPGSALPHWLRSGVIEPALRRLPPTAAKKGLVNKAKRFVEGARTRPATGACPLATVLSTRRAGSAVHAEARRQASTPVGAHILALADRRRAAATHATAALYVDFRSYLVDNCLAKVDRMSMACSLEARVPLLDREVVEFAFRLPPELKYNGSADQDPAEADCRAARSGRAASTARRRASAFRSRTGSSTSSADLVEQYLAPDRLRRAGLFDPRRCSACGSEHLANRANHSHVLWSLLVFEHWRDRWGVTI